MSGAVLLGIITLVLAGDLAIAAWFLRRARAAESDVGAPPLPGGADPAAVRRFARTMFIAAPAMWLFFAALTFGLFGPVNGITPITF
ncbi:hypothetical protein [Sphingomonas sp. KR3-1]|uniref:hypothetical protein n=1 Tax=Sphingomonas sp. KR3-1 TaxID=3156611 RepID=UPI0032B55B78